MKSKEDNLLINVYGPVQVNLKPDFLWELMEIILALEAPIIVVEDFNLGVVQRNLLAMLTRVWYICLTILLMILA